MSFESYLPPGLDRSHLAAVIGLVSDTHMPYRRRKLPANLADVLGGVDLLLHAGDVGELWVLDQLSAIAPVIAVHGNDDSEDSQRELPYQQIITIAGERILLWHSHFPDRKEEMASRAHNNLRRAIQRSVDRAKSAGARTVIFGHWHIPLVFESDDILIINPGALASGNEFSRMLRNTVALLFIEKNGTRHHVHIDLAAPETPYHSVIDWDGGFDVALAQFSRSIIARELEPAIRFMSANLTRAEILAIRPYLGAKTMPIWEREAGELTLADVEDALVHADNIPPEMHARIVEVWQKWKSQ